MDFDERLSDNNEVETGSDELLSDDNLRLPESANTLVRLHAVRAWLTRREKETTLALGEAALALQYAQMDEPQGTRLRRRERQHLLERVQQAQRALEEAQERLKAYEEAQALLEECVNHTTSGERVLVEYYLTLEELLPEHTEETTMRTPRLEALADVLHRVEHVGAPNEDAD